jgi:hypothetical protein
MNQKPWRPEIIDPGTKYLHGQYGITEPRRVHLSIQMDEMTHAGHAAVKPVSEFIDRIADMTETAGEFAFCVFIHAQYLATSSRIIQL